MDFLAEMVEGTIGFDIDKTSHAVYGLLLDQLFLLNCIHCAFAIHRNIIYRLLQYRSSILQYFDKNNKVLESNLDLRKLQNGHSCLLFYHIFHVI